ncbi:Protein kinase domain-containing protein [Psidium guajava]|nr:Protein kinase domain-containing protein [Psidium guajava]
MPPLTSSCAVHRRLIAAPLSISCQLAASFFSVTSSLAIASRHMRAWPRDSFACPPTTSSYIAPPPTCAVVTVASRRCCHTAYSYTAEA